MTGKAWTGEVFTRTGKMSLALLMASMILMSGALMSFILSQNGAYMYIKGRSCTPLGMMTMRMKTYTWIGRSYSRQSIYCSPRTPEPITAPIPNF